MPRVISLRRLDLDHVGAQVAERHADERPREDAGQVGDEQSLQCAQRRSRMAFRSLSTTIIRPGDQVLDVVVLGVEVAPGEAIGAARREHANQLRRELGRRPRQVAREDVRHLGLDETGADLEDGDAARARLGRQVLREPSDRSLAGAVVAADLAGEDGQVRRSAADDHDPAAAAREHRRQHGPAAEVRAENVHLEHLPPLLRRELPRGRAATADACVRDEQVDRSERLLGLVDHAGDILLSADVAGDRHRAEPGRRRFELLARAGGDRDARAGAGQLSCDAEPDSPRPARDEGDRAGEVVYGAATVASGCASRAPTRRRRRRRAAPATKALRKLRDLVQLAA